MKYSVGIIIGFIALVQAFPSNEDAEPAVSQWSAWSTVYGPNTEEEIPVYECPLEDGYYVNPDDCHYYHYCLDGHDMGRQQCDSGFKFNSDSLDEFWCDEESPHC